MKIWDQYLLIVWKPCTFRHHRNFDSFLSYLKIGKIFFSYKNQLLGEKIEIFRNFFACKLLKKFSNFSNLMIALEKNQNLIRKYEVFIIKRIEVNKKQFFLVKKNIIIRQFLCDLTASQRSFPVNFFFKFRHTLLLKNTPY